MDYEYAIKRPFEDLKKLLIGILLNILPIINFFAMGYVIESTKLTLEKKKTLPEWTNWKKLFVNGLLSFAMGLIFALPGIIFAGLGLGLGVIKGLLTKSVLEGVETGGPLLIAAIILFFIASYVMPLAIILFAKKLKFMDAFNFSEIIKKIFTGKYALIWLITMIINLVIVGVLSAIPLIGSAISTYLSAMITLTLFAQTYLEIK
ncbi:MAG: DUF4013 domain-containing protein [Candidatus Nanoarchaeia archaeon]|nr:DUF4013 domain-containing protein [Candidatus Nanoarchaeia archaeon]